MRVPIQRWLHVAMVTAVGLASCGAPRVHAGHSRSSTEEERLLKRGTYLATIGVCAACHTPPDVPASAPNPGDASGVARERAFRTDPDWLRYLDPKGKNALSGGVPFWMRFSATSHGVVYSRNVTPDRDTGLGSWTEDEVVRVIRTGKRKDGSSLFLFAPHSFFKNMAEEDARALAVYLRSLPPIRNHVPDRSLPFPVPPATDATGDLKAPEGRSLARGKYLVSAIVGCRECHSHNENGKLLEFVGGDPIDPFIGVFRLGPDLPLRSSERGIAAFPYPGYALLYAPNLTRFGKGGDLANVPAQKIVRALREGIGVEPDAYHRPDPLLTVMMWQFYSKMTDDDAYSIVQFLKNLTYVPHPDTDIIRFGADWREMFRANFKEAPSTQDTAFFGKQ